MIRIKLSFFVTLFLFAVISAPMLASAATLDAILPDAGNLQSIIFGTTNTGRQEGWVYRPAADHYVCSVTVSLQAVGVPTDAVSLKIGRYDQPFSYTAPNGYTSSAGFAEAVTGNTQTANTFYQVRVTASFESDVIEFDPCVLVQGGSWYFVWLDRTGALDDTNYYRVYGNTYNSSFSSTYVTGTGTFLHAVDAFSAQNLIVGNLTNASTGGAAHISINGNESFGQYNASSTLSYNGSDCTAPTSILDVGGGISYAFCYMFVPSPQVIEQFNSLDELIGTKFPFDYVGGMLSILDRIEVATTTDQGVNYSQPILFGVHPTSTVLMDLSDTVASGTPVHATATAVRDWIMVGIYLSFGLYAAQRVSRIL